MMNIRIEVDELNSKEFDQIREFLNNLNTKKIKYEIRIFNNGENITTEFAKYHSSSEHPTTLNSNFLYGEFLDQEGVYRIYNFKGHTVAYVNSLLTARKRANELGYKGIIFKSE